MLPEKIKGFRLRYKSASSHRTLSDETRFLHIFLVPVRKTRRNRASSPHAQDLKLSEVLILLALKKPCDCDSEQCDDTHKTEASRFDISNSRFPISHYPLAINFR